jgi:hypothetical protein
MSVKGFSENKTPKSRDPVIIASDKAWKKTMKDKCSCGADSRELCTCQRTEEYKKKAREIRKNWIGKEWDDPLASIKD